VPMLAYFALPPQVGDRRAEMMCGEPAFRALWAPDPVMTRNTLLRQLVEDATKPLQELAAGPQHPAAWPVSDADARDLFVWFEDTAERRQDGQRGIAGLPECLVPVARDMKILDRHYAPGHPHLLTAMRVRCHDHAAERIAAIYTAALAVGTVAWIGTGSQYETAWNALYLLEDDEAGAF